MKNTRHHLTFCLVTLVLAAGILGCATQQQVRKIVAQTNAAMIVGPSLEKAGVASSNTWQEAVGQIDQIIAQNPDQAILVNHLRVRQAMLLTVYEQGNLAEQRWNQVNSSVLTTERDKALYANRNAIVWWYKRAPDPKILDSTDQGEARKFMRKLDASISTIESHELKVYLATLRAQMALKLDGSASPINAEQIAKLHAHLVTHLKEYVNMFTPQEHKWVQNNPNTNVTAGYLSVTEFRNRVWLRSLIKAYFEIAEDSRDAATRFGLPAQPAWEPAWISTLNFNP